MGREAVAWSSHDDDAVAAAQLATSLRAGWRPEVAASPIPLFGGETYVASVDFRLDEYSGRDVSYSQGFFVGFGSPLFTAATLGGSVLWNRSQRNRAQAAAAPQWRGVASGVLHVTSLRFAMQGPAGWHEIAYSDVRSAQCLAEGLALFLAGRPPLRLVVVWPAYLFVLFMFLAYGQVVQPTIDDDLRERAARVGRALPAGPELAPTDPSERTE